MWFVLADQHKHFQMEKQNLPFNTYWKCIHITFQKACTFYEDFVTVGGFVIETILLSLNKASQAFVGM